MLKHFYSSDLQALADSLLVELQSRPRENPLRPETFVVQNFGMARWLSLFIAEKQDIAANLAFKFPAELYWQTMRVMDPDIPENLPSERIPMSWAIFEVLQHDNDSALSKLQQYVQHEDPLKQEVRSWNLASRIADVFDQYLTYRPEMLRKWERDKLLTGFNTEKWQAALWQKLNWRWKKRSKKEGTHRATLERYLIQSIENGEINIDKLPPRISIFAVSEMPEVYIKTLARLSTLTDVHFYSVDATSNEENMLIQSLGKVGMEFKSLLQKHIKEIENLTDVEIKNIDSDHPAADNFFKIVKRDLITGSNTGKQVQLDDSIQVHSCHSPRREVEVLFNRLLHSLDEDEALEPADIMVLCPQMDEYGPEIEAVFGAVEEDVPEIPYHLTETASEANIVDLTFRKLMQIIDSRFKVSEILDLIDCKPVRRAFSFTDDNANTLEKWIGDTRIHWGIDGKQKQALDLPASDSFTWRSGLNRMMAGYAMNPVDDTLFQQIYPYDEIQQTEHAQLLGRFSRFLNQLFDCHYQVKTQKTPAEWSEILNSWLSGFFPDEEEYFRDLQKLRKVIQSLTEQQQLADIKSPVSYRIIRSYLENQLEQKGTGGGRPGRGVTFSGMVPMRNIPAKVICMIGMNDGVFPRSKDSVEFNLIAKNPREGDRLPGKEDRQIFLENILAARNQVYFSYTGQSNKKEVEYPPSVVLREFMDYIIERYKITENEILQKHKLQPFSKQYFIKNRDHKLFSYSLKSRAIADHLLDSSSEENAFIKDKLPEPDESFKKLSVGELVAFFQHPAKFLLQQRLGIYLREDDVLDEDRENFDLGGLGRYHIGQEMLDRYLTDQASVQSFKDIAFAIDLLPEGWPGDQVFNKQERQVREFGDRIQEELAHRQLDPFEVDLKIEDYQIVGRLDNVYEHRQLLFRFGSMRPKDLIALWIKHLLLQSAKPEGHSGHSRLYTRHKKQGIAFFQFISIDKHREILKKLLQMYWAGLQRNTLFYPKSSFAYAEKVIYKNRDDEEGFKAADREWVDRYRGYSKEGDDPYVKRLSGNRNPFEHKEIKELFSQVSKHFWTPFFRELNKSEEGVI